MFGPASKLRLGPRQIGRALLVFGTLGIMSGLAALTFNWLVDFVVAQVLLPVVGPGPQATTLAELSWPRGARWLVLGLPALGGLIVGLLCSRYAPEAMGAGVGNVIDAYHRRGGTIRRRVPLVKALASALTLGTGGSAGREGPIGQICAGIASGFGRAFKASRAEQQVMVMAGFAAGIGAIFHAPMAAAIFAAEVLYSDVDLEHEVLVPSIITSTFAYAVYSTIMGDAAAFAVPAVSFDHGLELVPYTVLGVGLAVCAAGFIRFYTQIQSRWGFNPKVPLWLRPTLGGLGVGAVGLFLPHVLGDSREMAQLAIDGRLSLGLLLVLALGKMTTTTLTAGMGGSGGLFAPTLVIGGALGGAVGVAAHDLAPALGAEPAAFVVVGMAGFFASVANAPLSTVILVAEVVGSYELIVPTLWVCTLAWLFNRGGGLYRQQVPTRLDTPWRLPDMMGAVLHRISVADSASLDRDRLTTVFPGTPLREMVRAFSVSTQAVFPIVDFDGRLLGVVDGQALRRTLGEAGFDDLLIADDFLDEAVTVRRGESLFEAIGKMTASGYDHLIVVDDEDPSRLVGLLSRRQVVTAYHRRMLDAAPAPTYEHEPVPSPEHHDPSSLAFALALGGRVDGLGGETPEEALAELIRRAELPEHLDRDVLVKRLSERERLSSTGIGDGIALPHPHASDLEIEPPRVVLGLLNRAIAWQAFDDLPVDTVFLLLASANEQHLGLLSRLARALSDPTLRKLLSARASLPALIKRIREVEAEMTQRR